MVNLAVRRYTGIDNIVRKYTFIYVMWALEKGPSHGSTSVVETVRGSQNVGYSSV
jgi:hypothetical protein